MDKKRRQELDRILKYAAARKIPVPADALLEIVHGDIEEGLNQLKEQIVELREIRKIRAEELPLFTLSTPGAVPAPIESDLFLSATGWRRVTSETVYVGGGGGIRYPAGGPGYLYKDVNGVITWAAGGGGAGDVTGPAASVNGNFASFNGVTGKIIQDSGFSAASFQPVDATLTTLSALADAAGWLHNNGAGVLVWSTPTAADVGAPALVNPSVVGNFVSFSNITGAQQDSGFSAASFQTALVFPLAPNLGGTGVANAVGSTLTLGGATTISTGGTIALGGFTLTVPATGVAALLATRNVFTVQQMVDGTADEIQLRVQGHSTQTANLQTWETSTGSVVASIGPLGKLTVVTGATTVSALTCADILSSHTATGEYIIIAATGYSRHTSGTRAAFTGFQTALTHDRAGTVTLMQGYNLRAFMNLGNITTMAGFNSDNWRLGGATVQNIRFINVPSLILDSGSVANLCGIYVNNQTGGGTSTHAILTNSGNVTFNEGGDANTDFRVEGDTATNLLFTDASADAVQIGTTVAGAIAEFDATEITFNETGLSTLDFRVESDNQVNAIFLDSSADLLQLGVNVKIGAGVAATDYTLTFDGETNDGVITWMEDEDYFQFGDDIFIGTENLYFNGTDTRFYESGDDIHLDTPANYTLVLDEVVWDDLRVVPGSFDRPGVTDPTIVAYDVAGGGVNTYLWQFQKNAIASFTVQLPHSYKTGTDIYAHIHWTPGSRGAAENGNTVGWKIQYSWANINSNFAAMQSLDLSDACDGTDHKHQMTPEVVIDGHTVSKGISSMLLCNVLRTDTGADDTWVGTASGELPLLLEIDFHFQIDTIGSRQQSAK